jgi:diguanylate cyclase (GGDEF)-like protein
MERLAQALRRRRDHRRERRSLSRSRQTVAMRLIAPAAALVIAAILGCAALAHLLAKEADDYLESEHRQALAGAVEALQAVSPDLSRVEPQLIHVLERASGLKDLRFENEPLEASRKLQSMLDAKGRIVGWFSWEPERPATAMMNKLLPLAASIVLGLAGLGALAMWQLGRLGFQLDRSERHLRQLEHQDVLTGLPNHSHFFQLFDDALHSRSGQETLAFAVLDLDGFDEINHALGYAGGDEVLAQVGKRLQQAMPPGAVIGRLGSDEFAFLVTGVEPQQAMAAACALQRSLVRPFPMSQTVHVNACVGLAIAPRDGVARDELMRRAELALRAAKRSARGSVVAFAGEIEAEFDERRFITREVARALASGAFDVHYQPIVKADGGAIAGVEALLRWHHPTRGVVPPSVFVPIAEEAGLMNRLGEFALRRAISDAARWPDLYVSVNLSPVQVHDRAFTDLVSLVLEESGFEPFRLVLEMTESVLIKDPDATRARLEELQALGVRLALDDFGSGYSSLSYLQRLPFDKLKVDRSFVSALRKTGDGAIIVQALSPSAARWAWAS